MALIFVQLLLAAFAPVFAEIEMQFTKYPESVTAPPGDEVTFECAVRVPGERLAWRWKPVDRPEDPWMDAPGTSDKDSMSTKLVVNVKEDTPSTLYQCVVWYGAVSLASIPARLTIARLDPSRNVARRRVITAPPGNFIALHCREPLSEPPAQITWWRDLGHGRKKKQLDTPHGVLVIHNATVDDSGVYGCTANNEISGQSLDLPETTYLKIQPENGRGPRFLEEEQFVGTVTNEGVLTMPIRPGGSLRLWCGAVDTPPPQVTWTKEGENLPRTHEQALVITEFTSLDEGIYTCTANPSHPIRRSWKVIALEPPRWEESVVNVNATEGSSAHIACGTPYGQPPPTVHWLLNAEPLTGGNGIRATGSDLYIDHVEKRHAGIVQCFACNPLGCAYDAALLTVVPVQISDQFSMEASPMQFPLQPPKRHNRKNPRKHKAVLIPPSRPNITRMSDSSVMVSWSHVNHGLPIQFYKIQYREVTSNSSSNQWHTESTDIPPRIHSFLVENLIPDRSYKFRVAAVYSNQDNKSGKSSVKFHLKRGGPKGPPAPVLTRAVALSTEAIQLNWTWSENARGAEWTREPVMGFYVYFRVLSSAGAYEQVLAPVRARSLVLQHLLPDTAYELKLQAYTEQAPSDFSSILVAKTLKVLNATGTTEAPPDESKTDERAPGALVTAGGALGVAALLGILAVTLLLCRRAKRPPSNKEKGTVPESGGTNGYIPAKVPITITANPMHTEGGDSGVEMSFLHNNNTGSNDDTLPHSRKNGPATRQYV